MFVKDELLDRVVDRVREQLPEGQAPQVEEFVRQYYGWVPPEDLTDRSPIDAYGAAVSHWSFARQRTPGSAKIRVYNPQLEEHGWQSTHTVVEIVNDDMPFLVDSTRMEITRQGYAIHLMLHPIIGTRRDDEGRLVNLTLILKLESHVHNLLSYIVSLAAQKSRLGTMTPPHRERRTLVGRGRSRRGDPLGSGDAASLVGPEVR